MAIPAGTRNIQGVELEWFYVSSSNVDWIAYNEQLSRCYVAFQDGGDIYYWDGIDPYTFKRFQRTDSPGGFVWNTLGYGAHSGKI